MTSEPSSCLTALSPPPAGARRIGIAAVRPAGASPPCRRRTGYINICLYAWIYGCLPSLQATQCASLAYATRRTPARDESVSLCGSYRGQSSIHPSRQPPSRLPGVSRQSNPYIRVDRRCRRPVLHLARARRRLCPPPTRSRLLGVPRGTQGLAVNAHSNSLPHSPTHSLTHSLANSLAAAAAAAGRHPSARPRHLMGCSGLPAGRAGGTRGRRRGRRGTDKGTEGRARGAGRVLGAGGGGVGEGPGACGRGMMAAGRRTAGQLRGVGWGRE
jgi:hypothetical protein